jgi:hypothetical protein
MELGESRLLCELGDFSWGSCGVDLFVFCALFWFLCGFSGSVWFWFGALSMLLKVTFYVVKVMFDGWVWV